jgi:hypothetical protein
MVIDYFDVGGTGIPARPLETDPPLDVDPDAVLAGAVTLQRFQPIAPERPQLVQPRGCAENFQSPIRLPGKAAELANELAVGKGPGPSIPITQDHE